MAIEVCRNPKILVPETIDELLDICANIYRNIGGRFDGPTLSKLYAPGSIRDNSEDVILFYNGKDQPFCVWGQSDGVEPSKLLKDMGSFLYAYRVGGNETIKQFPVRDLKLGWTSWVETDRKYLRNAWTDATQFLGEMGI